MDRELNRAITQMIQDCPSAARVIQAELKKRVEVVRCGECCYWDKATVIDGFLICPASGMEITANDFCSYGKRK